MVVGPGGLEPPTSRLSGVCSNQLSYRPETITPHPREPDDQAGARRAGRRYGGGGVPRPKTGEGQAQNVLRTQQNDPKGTIEPHP